MKPLIVPVACSAWSFSRPPGSTSPSMRWPGWMPRWARSSLRSVTWPLRVTVSDLPKEAGAWVDGVATAVP